MRVHACIISELDDISRKHSSLPVLFFPPNVIIPFGGGSSGLQLERKLPNRISVAVIRSDARRGHAPRFSHYCSLCCWWRCHLVAMMETTRSPSRELLVQSQLLSTGSGVRGRESGVRECLTTLPCLPLQDPSGGDQRAAGRGQEDGERRAAGHHLGAAAHGQAHPVHAVQHAGRRGPGQVRRACMHSHTHTHTLYSSTAARCRTAGGTRPARSAGNRM